MSCRLLAVCFAAQDPMRLAEFWAGLLGWDSVDDYDDGVALLPGDDTGFRLRFVPTDVPKTAQNRMHFDLTSTSELNQRQVVEQALELGGRHVDVGQRGDEGHVVLGDPEGNEFDVIEPGNRFLADCGFVGALACDGSQQVGYFWSKALDWPLVWDQDQETAIRSPHGGSKITWGGPPFAPPTSAERVHFDLAAAVPGEHEAEEERLVALGATRASVDSEAGRWTGLSDPDGNAFCLWRD